MANGKVKADTKWVQVYLNGYHYSTGIKCLVSKRYYRSFEVFLNYITEKLQPSFGAIRNIYTPNNGHKIVDLDELIENHKYVAAGNERFKKTPLGPGGEEKTNRTKDTPPATKMSHARITKKLPGPYQITVYIHRNGDENNDAAKFVFRRQELLHWDRLLQTVADKIQLYSGRIKRLCTLDGKTVKSSAELLTGETYVAVGAYEAFKRCHYKVRPCPARYLVGSAGGSEDSGVAGVSLEGTRPHADFKTSASKKLPLIPPKKPSREAVLPSQPPKKSNPVKPEKKTKSEPPKVRGRWSAERPAVPAPRSTHPPRNKTLETGPKKEDALLLDLSENPINTTSHIPPVDEDLILNDRKLSNYGSSGVFQERGQGLLLPNYDFTGNLETTYPAELGIEEGEEYHPDMTLPYFDISKLDLEDGGRNVGSPRAKSGRSSELGPLAFEEEEIVDDGEMGKGDCPTSPLHAEHIQLSQCVDGVFRRKPQIKFPSFASVSFQLEDTCAQGDHDVATEKGING